MAKTFLFIPTTFLLLWLSGTSGFNFPLTSEPKPGFEKSIAGEEEINSEFKVKTIVIDAGHGGRDGGCSGAHSKEKVINLEIAKKIQTGIERQFPEMKVIMTRDKDVFIPLHRRAKIANDNEADLFLSIHCNAIRSTKHIHGSESYVLGLHRAKRNLEVAKRENDVIFMEEDYEKNYGFDPNSPAGHIMISAFQNANLEQSILFAEKIEMHIKLQTPHKSRGVKQAGFHVLREVSMPSVLLETGYLTSRKDEAFLSDEKGQNYIARAVVNALYDFKEQVETGHARIPPRKQLVKSPLSVSKKSDSASKVDKKEQAVENPVNDRPILYAKSPNTSEKVTEKPIVEKLTPEPVKNTPKIRVIEEVPVAEKPEVQYKIQIAASQKPVEINSFSLQKGGYVVKTVEEVGMLKYQTGVSETFEQALQKLNFVKKAGFKDAFIVAYNRGKKISIAEAKRLTR